jgi:hypothetical protein
MTYPEIIAAYEALREDYRTYVGEALACGHEVLSFEHWSGQSSPKEEAVARWKEHEANDTLDLY